MPDSTWLILILVLVAALVYGAFLLGRASAPSQVQARPAAESTSPVEPSSNAQAARPAPARTAAPPPVLAGGDNTATGSQAGAPTRHSAPPPAASAGPSSRTQSNEPRRSGVAPPPAQAAWSNPAKKDT